jgi:hypothetical protein
MEEIVYAYGMRAHGFGLSFQPMRGWLDRKGDPLSIYYDILFYRNKLTDQEMDTYELDYLGTAEEYYESRRKIY